MNEPRDEDPDSIESLHRAMRGQPRPIPEKPPVPEGLVREVVQMFGELYRYDPESEVPRDLHESRILPIWSDVEPEALRRLQVAFRELEDRGLLPGDEWIGEARLQEWAEGVVELLEAKLRRIGVEVELATDRDGMVDVDQLISGLGTIHEDPDGGED